LKKVVGVIAVLVVLNMIFGGKSNTNDNFVTEKEYAIMWDKRNVSKYKKKQFSGIKHVETRVWLDDFFIPVDEAELVDSKMYPILTIKEVEQLVQSKNKSIFLRRKGYYLFDLQADFH